MICEKIIQPVTELHPDSLLLNVEPIEKSMELTFNIQDIGLFVEQPLVNVVRQLMENNIRTIECSANRDDVIRGQGFLVIDLETLSNYNRSMCYSNTQGVVTKRNFEKDYPNWAKKRILNRNGKKLPFISIFESGLYRCCSAVIFEYPVNRSSTIQSVEKGFTDMISFLRPQEKQVGYY